MFETTETRTRAVLRAWQVPRCLALAILTLAPTTMAAPPPSVATDPEVPPAAPPVGGVPLPADTTESSTAQSEAALLSANPDAPTTGLAWRTQLRGQVGVRIAFLRDPTAMGFHLQLPALIELFNEQPSVVPYQYWRGRLALEALYRTRFSARGAVAVGLAIEHESDHASAPAPYGFLNLNSVSARGDLTLPVKANAVTASATARLHVLTCTTDDQYCYEGNGLRGSRSLELDAEVVFDGGTGPRAMGRWRMFASAFGALVIPHDLVAGEHRLVLDAGVWTRTETRGMFQLYATMLAGNDVGLFLQEDVVQAGGGFRWAL